MSVYALKYHHLTKSLSPFPEKFHGLTDVEERYRRRYVDLIMNEDARKVALHKLGKECYRIVSCTLNEDYTQEEILDDDTNNEYVQDDIDTVDDDKVEIAGYKDADQKSIPYKTSGGIGWIAPPSGATSTNPKVLGYNGSAIIWTR